MAESRDDFIIAIRSAFLKKSTKQKFSLLTLALFSVLIISLSSFDFKIIRYLKIGINEFVYRSSFIVSIPENFIKNSFFEVKSYTSFFKDYKKNKDELESLKSNYISNEIIQFENIELKELINDYVSSSDKILAKIIVDHDSPYLKSIIINKGSKDNIRIGTSIYDQSYLVGRVIEVNYKTSRVLLLSDLNSNVPVTIAPQNIQAIITGSGDYYGEIKYTKEKIDDEFSEESIIYTSGTGAIFKSGIPIGKLKIKENVTNKYFVEFFSDFSQLKYVFAEIETRSPVINLDKELNEINSSNLDTTLETKLNILEDEIKIIDESNLKFKEENEKLKGELNFLKSNISRMKNEIFIQKKKIDQFDVDKDEIIFLKLNLEHGHKCRKSFLNNKGFEINTPEYRNCVISKEINNE